MDQYKFSKLKDCDLKEASIVYKNSINDNTKGFIQDIDFHGSLKSMNDDFSKNNGGFYILKDDNKIIGLGALKKEDLLSVEICKIHLIPSYKGKGLGEYLAKKLLEEAKKINYIRMNLHVTKTQTPAINLYKKLGFKKYKEEVYKINTNNETLSFDTLFMGKNI